MASSRDSQYAIDTLTDCMRALKRRPNDSDSDDVIDRPTNRGQKLKKRARFVRRGQLAPPNGPPLYRETVEHAGHRRDIISRNPPLIDAQGFAIDSEDDEDAVNEAQAAADEQNPWAGIRIDEIKAPLSSVTELATNPHWNRPYLSSGLDELCMDAQGMVKREKAALETVKQLRRLLCGDLPFAPAGTMLGPHDDDLFDSRLSTQRLVEARRRILKRDMPKAVSPRVNGESSTRLSVGPPVNGLEEKTQAAVRSKLEKRREGSPADVAMEDMDGSKADDSTARVSNTSVGTGKGRSKPTQPAASQAKDSEPANPPEEKKTPVKEGLNGERSAKRTPLKNNAAEPVSESTVDPPGKEPNGTGKAGPTGNGERLKPDYEDATWSAPSNVAADNAIAAAASQTAPGAVADHGGTAGGPDDEGDMASAVNALFLIPWAARPHRDAGLPEQEAEDVRRLVQLYIHKQEEIDRGTQSLHRGLLWANARRREVLKWSKAEAHCGPNRDMSDGEDWYDMEEWGLTEELKKGQDEEEEDNNNTRDQPKKTRNRR